MGVSPKSPRPSQWARSEEGRSENRFAAAIAQWYNRPAEPKTQGAQRSAERAMRVLVVDDDAPSRKMIGFLLREEGYTVFSAGSGPEALALLDKEMPDLVVLDVMMPGMDGLEVCRRIRRLADLPIIFLSAKGEMADRVAGLDSGGDDYLPKPFEPAELLARVRAVMRRAEAFAFGDKLTHLVVGGIHLDPVNNKAVLADGGEVYLTPIEFRLLHYLMSNAGRTMTHDQLFATVWGYDFDGSTNLVAAHMRRLRRKVEEEPSNPQLLLTVRGVGYRFAAS
jgi:DNA-binding response OmpR family regulator